MGTILKSSVVRVGVLVVIYGLTVIYSRASVVFIQKKFFIRYMVWELKEQYKTAFDDSKKVLASRTCVNELVKRDVEW